MTKQKYNPRSLLDALVIFSRIHGKPFSAEVLTKGLPVNEHEQIPKLYTYNRRTS